MYIEPLSSETWFACEFSATGAHFTQNPFFGSFLNLALKCRSMPRKMSELFNDNHALDLHFYLIFKLD